MLVGVSCYNETPFLRVTMNYLKTFFVELGDTLFRFRRVSAMDIFAIYVLSVILSTPEMRELGFWSGFYISLIAGFLYSILSFFCSTYLVKKQQKPFPETSIKE